MMVANVLIGAANCYMIGLWKGWTAYLDPIYENEETHEVIKVDFVKKKRVA